ncbi:hypothetical protein PIB30_065909, partial [Stylosanthes scabra]|nr:hypothetical protein [Stylosanthes scabra]
KRRPPLTKAERDHSITEPRSSLRAWTNFRGILAWSVEGMVRLTLVYHHGGNLVTKDNGNVAYEVDHTELLEELDEDILDVFALKNHHFVLGYEKIEECSWLVPGSNLEIGLRPITNDVELLEMCCTARGNNSKIHIYYEHVVSIPQVEEDVLKLIELTPNSATMH